MPPPISFVFVPGAWHLASVWNKVTTILEAQGRTCVAVTLPSTTGDPSMGLEEDVKAVQDAAKAEFARGHNVVLVVHSYGGHVGGSAIKTLARDGTAEQGRSTPSDRRHIIGLAMIATGFPRTGVAFLDGFGGSPPPLWYLDRQTGFVSIVVDPRDMMYHDLSQEEGALWVSRLTKHTIKSLEEGAEHVYSGWRDVPCWYLVAAEDHALPPDMQRLFIKTAQNDGGDITVREVQSSHSPMLSQPRATAEFLQEAAASFIQKS
jgi:pimeloyl-ACP methyl ester carboxylesterase